MSENELKTLYALAKQSLADKDYDNSVELLKRILMENENYRDASLLLAQTVRLKRRRWYNHPLLWGGLGLAALIALGIFLAPQVRDLYASQIPMPTARSTNTPGPTAGSTNAPGPTATPTITPTPVALAWERISMGQVFERDQITVIVIDPKDAEVAYAGTDNAGIYKSIDGGVSWKPVHNGLGRASIYSLVIDPLQPSNLYAGAPQGGVYKTTDGGEHWAVATDSFQSGTCIVVIDHSQPNRLLYTDGTNIYASSNGAETWGLIKNENTCPNQIAALAWHPQDSAIIFATNKYWAGNCALSGVYRSEDGGTTWTPPKFEIVRPHDNSLLISQQTGNNLFVQTDEGRLFVSRDGGINWEEENKCGLLVLDPQNESNIYCASGDELQKYEVIPEKPEQKWWRVAPLPARAGWFDTLVISPHSSQTMFFGVLGIWSSSDGGLTWNERSNGLGAGRIELRVDPLQPSTLYADGGGCQSFFSNDAGRTWEKATEWDCGMSMSLDGEARYWLDTSQYPATVNISTDAGNTWTKYLFEQPIISVVAHPTIPGRVYAICETDVPSCIYVSSDYGQTWHNSIGINKLVGGGMFFSDSPGQRIYVVSGDWQIYASDDSGENWNESTTGAVHAKSNATRLVIDPSDANHILLATLGQGILVSTDGGQNWQESSNGLGSLFVNTLAFDPNNPDLIYAGTDGGAYVSFDGGETWGRINDGLLGATVVYSIVVDKDSNVYAATPYGIFKLEHK